MTTPAGPLAVLTRIRAARAVQRSDEERCEMCGEPIAGEHAHVVHVANRSLMCTCRPCYLLFTRDDATLAYRSVPDRYLSFPTFRMQWDDLQIPVGLAFFFRNSEQDRIVAFYPGPAGATESELPLGAWERIVADNPALSTMAPDVEAILIRSGTVADGTDAGSECFLVPIDACYALVGSLRRLWRGFDGGQDVHRRLAEFFGDLRSRSRPAPEPAS